MTATAERITPYLSVTSAVKSAYERYDQVLYSRPVYLQQMAPARGGNPLDMNAADWVAQNQIIISKIQQLEAPYALAIEGMYCPGAPYELARIKVAAVDYLVQHLRETHDRFDVVPREYVLACVGRWSGIDEKLSMVDWAQKLGCSRQTLEAVRYGRRQRRQHGVFRVLDELLNVAMGELRDRLVSGGIVSP